MAYRTLHFTNDAFYHLFNRGVEKRQIFSNSYDYSRFLDILYYYQFEGPKPRFSTYKRFRQKDFDSKPKIIEIICYCLMPNHFHLLVRQLRERGVEEFMRKVLNSYTKYFNTRYRRIGPLLQGTFKAVFVENDEQLLHLSRYIHLNPFVSGLVDELSSYQYSSFRAYIKKSKDKLCLEQTILDFFKDSDSYAKFIADHQGYAKELDKIKHLLIEEI